MWDQTRSLCIDAGDPSFPYDADNTIADIGTLYFYQGIVPNIELSTDSLDFDSVWVGAQAELSLTLYNAGDTILVLYDVYNDDPAFSINWDPADSLITPGDSLQIAVFFQPGAAIAYLDTLAIENNDELAIIRLQGLGSGPIAINLTPHNPPILIPGGGGSFNFDIEVENISDITATFDVWTNVLIPNGSVVPILLRADLSLPVGGSAIRTLTQSVPGSAPVGYYSYRGYVGTYPDDVQNDDYFSFAKLYDDTGPSYNTGWTAFGWDEESVVSSTPSEYAINPAYPNPFNPTTVLSYQLQVASKVNLSVYDVSGRLVAQLINGWRDAGSHEVMFDASDLASGIYIYRLTAGDFSATGKMVLMK